MEKLLILLQTMFIDIKGILTDCKKDSSNYEASVGILSRIDTLDIMWKDFMFENKKHDNVTELHATKKEVSNSTQKSRNTKQMKSSDKNDKPRKYHSFHLSMPICKPLSKRLHKCPLCKFNHALFQCRKFKKMTSIDKLDVIKKRNICKNCLYVHEKNYCKSLKRCKKCNNAHNTLLHDASASMLRPHDSIASPIMTNKCNTESISTRSTKNKPVKNNSNVSKPNCSSTIPLRRTLDQVPKSISVDTSQPFKRRPVKPRDSLPWERLTSSFKKGRRDNEVTLGTRNTKKEDSVHSNAVINSGKVESKKEELVLDLTPYRPYSRDNDAEKISVNNSGKVESRKKRGGIGFYTLP